MGPWLPSYGSLRIFLDGMLGMMALYALLSYWQQRKPIYWQYALYILCMGITFRLDDQDYTSVHYAPGANYAVVILETTAFILYIRFALRFINIARFDPRSYRLMQYMTRLLLLGALLDTIFWLAGASDAFRSGHYTLNRLSLAALALVVVPRIFRLRQPVVSYFIMGSFFFVSGCVVALAINFLPVLFTRDPANPFSYPVSYMEIGVVLEVLCFTLGLARLNLQTEREKQQVQAQLIEQLQENERKQQKLQRIRDDIARDLHDELGADLGGIGMLALAASRQLTSRPAEVTDKLMLISQSARRVVATMREIIWNLNSAHDTLQNLANRLEETARTLLGQQSIALRLDLPPPVIDGTLPAEYRRDLFLLFKEALHNLIRHAGATEAMVGLSVTVFDGPPALLTLTVTDNGCGFDPGLLKPGGNGLVSMRQRAAALGGELILNTTPNGGTSIRFTGRVEGIKQTAGRWSDDVVTAGS